MVLFFLMLFLYFLCFFFKHGKKKEKFKNVLAWTPCSKKKRKGMRKKQQTSKSMNFDDGDDDL